MLPKLERVISLLRQGHIDQARYYLFEAEFDVVSDPETHGKYINEFRILHGVILKASSQRLEELRRSH